MKCIKCNCEGKILSYHHVINIKNHIIEFDLPRLICPTCHNIIPDNQLDEMANLELIRRYNNKFGIPRETLINLRKSFNLSQETFAAIIGCAKKTLVSYETGNSIPNDIYMTILKVLINKPIIIIDLLKANENDYSKEEYNRILEKINLTEVSNDKFSDKIENLILYLSENGVSKTKVQILLYLCDAISYKENGFSVTDITYTKRNDGPYSRIIEEKIDYMINNNYLECIYDVSGNKEMNYLKALVNAKTNFFLNKEFTVIEQVRKDHKLSNVEQMINILKNDNTYSKIKIGNEISYK